MTSKYKLIEGKFEESKASAKEVLQMAIEEEPDGVIILFRKGDKTDIYHSKFIKRWEIMGAIYDALHFIASSK